MVYAVATDATGRTANSAHVSVVPGAVTSVETLEATDDAALKGRTSDRNQNNNYGGVELWTREPDPTDGDQSIVSIFKFDASSLVSEAQIREATLRLYVSDTRQGSADFAAWSTAGATSWTEETVTWNNGPTKKDKLSATRVTANNNWYEWDVTDYMDAMLKTDGSSLASVTFWLEGDQWTGQSTGWEFDSPREDEPSRAPASLAVTRGYLRLRRRWYRPRVLKAQSRKDCQPLQDLRMATVSMAQV